MFLGPQGEIVDEVKKHGHGLRDLNWREIAIMVPILILIFWIGSVSQTILRPDGSCRGSTCCQHLQRCGALNHHDPYIR